MKIEIPVPDKGMCPVECPFHQVPLVDRSLDWCYLDVESCNTMGDDVRDGRIVPGPDCPGPGVYRLVKDDPKKQQKRNAKAKRERKKARETEDWVKKHI